MISLARTALLLLLGALIAVGGTLLFLYLEDINKPNPTRQLQAALRDKTTMRAFAAIGGVTMVALYHLSLWLIKRRAAKHRQRAGLCTSCGYDLRASQGACPECGNAILPSGSEKTPV